MDETKVQNEEEFVEESEVGSDDLELSDEEATSEEKVKSIKAKLRVCEKEKQEHLDGWQRARADFLNFKRRTEEDAARREEMAAARHAESLLPLLDSFALATKGKAWEEADKNFKVGFEMIRAQLDTILRDYKVERVDPLHAPFDPTLHEALSERPVEDTHVGTVVETIQVGYTRGAAVIRPARVVVGKHTA